MAGWAYPTLAHVDSVNPGSINDIHAFRVDVIQNTGEFKVPTCRDEYTLSCIPLSGQGPVPAQFAVYFDYGVVVWPLMWEHCHRTIKLRLYRSGWETVQLESWASTSSIKWQRAQDLLAREKAIDAIVKCDDPGRGVLMEKWLADFVQLFPREVFFELGELYQGVLPGSRLPQHKEVLLFVAEEYERLAAAESCSNANRDGLMRLSNKAKWVRALAER
jgi:hypothetical protein